MNPVVPTLFVPTLLTVCVLFFTVNIKILKRNTKRRRKPNTKMEVQRSIKTNTKTETRKNERRKRYRTFQWGMKRCGMYFSFCLPVKAGIESTFID